MLICFEKALNQRNTTAKSRSYIASSRELHPVAERHPEPTQRGAAFWSADAFGIKEL